MLYDILPILLFDHSIKSFNNYETLQCIKTMIVLFVNSCEDKHKPQWLTEQFQWKHVLVV